MTDPLPNHDRDAYDELTQTPRGLRAGDVLRAVDSTGSRPRIVWVELVEAARPQGRHLGASQWEVPVRLVGTPDGLPCYLPSAQLLDCGTARFRFRQDGGRTLLSLRWNEQLPVWRRRASPPHRPA